MTSLIGLAARLIGFVEAKFNRKYIQDLQAFRKRKIPAKKIEPQKIKGINFIGSKYFF